MMTMMNDRLPASNVVSNNHNTSVSTNAASKTHRADRHKSSRKRHITKEGSVGKIDNAQGSVDDVALSMLIMKRTRSNLSPIQCQKSQMKPSKLHPLNEG
jgi:hypothetical protein